jgi:hypothetical protein
VLARPHKKSADRGEWMLKKHILPILGRRRYNRILGGAGEQDANPDRHHLRQNTRRAYTIYVGRRPDILLSINDRTIARSDASLETVRKAGTANPDSRASRTEPHGMHILQRLMT